MSSNKMSKNACASDVTIDYEVQDVGGCFMSARTIETPEDAAKALNDYLPVILPAIHVNIRTADKTTYMYVLEPEDYVVQMLRLMKKDVLRNMKDSLKRLLQQLEEEEEYDNI